jgi:DNA ligase (NAD+)
LLYSPPNEYAFAILYFTGSKSFNTSQRQRAVDLGFSLNEHGIYEMIDGNKESKVKNSFLTEQSIFDFLEMEYKEPKDRIDGSSVIAKKGKISLELLTEKELVELIYKANQYYYVKGRPIMTDDEYDSLIDYSKKKYPKNKKIIAGHSSVDLSIESTKSKIQLPYEMWSMDKIKPDTDELKKWTDKFKGSYVISCKLDGVSCLYVSPNKLYTRGNGKIGQDISNLIPYFKLPTEKGLVIRGELIINKLLFDKKYGKEFANSRNFVAGVINTKKPHTERLNDICFVAYELIQPVKVPYEQLNILSKLNIETVKYTLKTQISNDILSNILTEWKKISEYEIDGIICCDNNIYKRKSGNPQHAFAFKMITPDITATTEVVSVIWTPSKDGYLKPRVKFVPITICGVSIEYATGFNAKFIVDNKIGIGSVVTIIRSGDVIPHIINVIKHSSEPMMPSEKYVWNNTNIDIVLVDKTSDTCVNHKIITSFFKTIGVEGLGPGNIKRIMEAGYNSVPLIISMKREQYLEIEGFKQKMSDKIYEGIKEKINQASLPLLMDATNLFGRGFGEKKFQAILTDIPDILTSDVSYDEKIVLVENVNGIAYKSAKQFVENIPAFIKWCKIANVESKLFTFNALKPNVVFQPNKLFGKKIVITGFRDKLLVTSFEKLGAININSVTKDTDIVIVKNYDFDSTKMEAAKKLNISIMDIDKFKQEYNIS